MPKLTATQHEALSSLELAQSQGLDVCLGYTPASKAHARAFRNSLEPFGFVTACNPSARNPRYVLTDDGRMALKENRSDLTMDEG
ncbi:hypothetical protein G6L37_01730 [Agrobacterium rubi]|nr:hypothetical protein [Agrobacterium rubi]NTF24114.1 hypothetical protein [Agrobacterium rubi]